MPSQPTNRGVAGLVLAAGASERMGSPKALLDWGGMPLLQLQVDVLVAAGCSPVVVVLGHKALQIEGALPRPDACQIVINTQHMSGRASSVRAGASVLADDLGAVVLSSVDTPCSAGTVRSLIDAWRTDSAAGTIVVPRYEGGNGHPALFDGSLLADLRAVEERSEGLRAVRRAHAETTRFLDVDDPLVALNLNTPEAYEAARAAAGSSRGSSPEP